MQDICFKGFFRCATTLPAKNTWWHISCKRESEKKTKVVCTTHFSDNVSWRILTDN